LFTEPYIWSFTVFAVWGIAKRSWFAAGIALGLAFFMKETAALIVVPLLIFVLRRYGIRQAAMLGIGPAVALLVFLVKNAIVYGAVLATFQAFQLGVPLEGLMGLVIDLRRGLLWFAPLLIVASLGWFVPWSRSRPRTSELYLTLAVVGAHYVLTASWIDWQGGSCYGPRLLVHIMPLLAIPLVRLWREGLPWMRGAVVLAALFGITVQVCAALDPFRAFWFVSVSELLLSDWWARLLGVVVGSQLLWWIVPRGRDP
jgi:hypothetical protein